MSNDEPVGAMKVKADRQDATPGERSRAARKLAGAIAHSLRKNGEIPVRCFGNASIGKGIKAIAIAGEFIYGHNLEIYCVPAFIDTEMDGMTKTGLSFLVFASPDDEGGMFDGDDEGIMELWVKSDRPDVGDRERKKAVRKLAGSIAHNLREQGKVLVRCFGNAWLGKASKAKVVARGMVAVNGYDLFMVPRFIKAEMAGETKTGIAFYVIAEGGQ
jgi:stage V sporulation protein S